MGASVSDKPEDVLIHYYLSTEALLGITPCGLSLSGISYTARAVTRSGNKCALLSAGRDESTRLIKVASEIGMIGNFVSTASFNF